MNRLRLWMSACSTVLLCVPPLPAQGKTESAQFEQLLHGLTDLDALWRAVRLGEREWQYSSYDRASDKGPGDEKAWFANGDAGHFLRVDTAPDGGKRFVLCDAEGPGVIQRIWSANPHGKLSFTFDDEEAPRWTVDFAALLRGEIAPLAPPLCSTVARGGNCYLPIPFGKRVVVSTDEGGFYYQVNVRSYGDGAALGSFDPAWLTTHAAAIAKANSALLVPARDPGWTVSDHGSTSGQDGREVQLRVDGPAVVHEFRVKFKHARDAKLPEHFGRAVWLRIDCDGERTEVPWGDFFGCGPELRPWKSLALEVQEDGTCVCRFPIPVREHLVISAQSEDPLAVVPAWSCVTESRAVPADALVFHASWSLSKDHHTRPFADHLVLDVTGSGRFAGVTLSVRNPTRAWWGEGDEKAWIDGETFPSTFGTGTEDYFGYAWCCPELFSQPYHAQPRADGPANFGFVSNVRLQITDSIPFRNHLKFAFEIWHWKDVHIDYATCAYWYGSAGSKSGLPPIPDLATRLPTPLAAPAMFVASDALEGEEMKVLERTGGSSSMQDLSGFAEMRWSKDAHLWWVDGKPGDRLVLALPVPDAGRYRIEGVLTTARDYGKVTVDLDGVALGGEIDLYTKDVEATGVLVFGTATLTPGEHRLGFTIRGHNRDAIPRHMVGIDWIRAVMVD